MHPKASAYDAKHRAARMSAHGAAFYADVDLNTPKVCRDCCRHKPLAAFHRQVSERDGFNSRCKECNNHRRAEFSAKHPERQRKIHKGAQLRYKYGLTPEQYQAMLVAQSGGCAICGADSPGCGRTYFSVDHCHASGRVRGLLCSNCNSGIGLLGDSASTVAKALAYLQHAGKVADVEVVKS